MTATDTGRLRHLVVTAFILTTLWVMVSTNLRLGAPRIPGSLYPSRLSYVVNRINWAFAYADWAVQNAGRLVGVRNLWRMFSPPDRLNWYMTFSGVYEDGREEILPLPHQIPRSFLQRNLIDFREAKYMLNIRALTKPAEHYYEQYLCRTLQDHRSRLVAVSLVMRTQDMRSPQEAREQGTFLAPDVNMTRWVFWCGDRGRRSS